jgi:hypothetical protein
MIVVADAEVDTSHVPPYGTKDLFSFKLCVRVSPMVGANTSTFGRMREGTQQYFGKGRAEAPKGRSISAQANGLGSRSRIS